MDKSTPQDAGSLARRDTSKPQREDWIEEQFWLLGSTIAQTIHEIDHVLFEYTQVVERGQPSLEGKISLRWWRDKSRPGLAPYPFRWERTSSGEWRCEHLPISRLASRRLRKGAFHDMEDTVGILLKEIQQLIELRKSVLRSCGIFERTLSRRVAGIESRLAESLGCLERYAEQIESHPTRLRRDDNWQRRQAGEHDAPTWVIDEELQEAVSRLIGSIE